MPNKQVIEVGTVIPTKVDPEITYTVKGIIPAIRAFEAEKNGQKNQSIRILGLYSLDSGKSMDGSRIPILDMSFLNC